MGSEWTQTTVGSFCPFSYGKGLPEKKRIPNGRFIVYGSNGPVGTHDQPLVNEPGIVIGRKGTVGAVHFASKPFWPIDTTYYVLSASGRHLRYTYYLLKSIGLENMNADSAVPGLNRNAVHAKQILVPSYDEQHAIAHILGSLDDKIELNRRMNQTLEAIARAIFKSWFIDFDPVIDNALRAGNPIPDLMAERAEMRRQILDQNQPTSSNHRAKGRDYQGGFDSSGLGEVSIDEIHGLFPDSFQASELGAIPKGWEVRKFEEFVTPRNERVEDRDIPEYSSTNKGLFPRSVFFKKQLSKSKAMNKVIRKHDLVFGLSRQILNFGIMKDSIGAVSPAYHVFSVNVSIIFPEFIELYMRERMNLFFRIVGASSREGQSISINQFYQTSLIAPPNSIQDTFRKFTSNIKNVIRHYEEESRTLMSLRDTLLPKLISGELRVPDAEKFVKEIGL